MILAAKLFTIKNRFSSTRAQKIQAIETVKEYQQETGLQHGYAEEGLGTLQPWAENVQQMMSVLNEKDGARRVSSLPKERVDLYSLLHILKSEGDSYLGNTLLSKSNHFIDCDEEITLQPGSEKDPKKDDFNKQVMWELGLPQANTPIKPLLLRLMLHPYFRRTCEELPQALLTPKAGNSLLTPFREQIRETLQQPLENFGDRAKKIQQIATQSIKSRKPRSVRDIFFEIYDDEEHSAKKRYESFLQDPKVKDRLAAFFEIYLGKKAAFGAPACLNRWVLPKFQHYVTNVKDLSQMQ